jgi:hypothetical protein
MWLALARPDAISNVVDYAKHGSRSHDAVIRVHDEADNVIQTHEHADEFKEWWHQIPELIEHAGITSA